MSAAAAQDSAAHPERLWRETVKRPAGLAVESRHTASRVPLMANVPTFASDVTG